MRKLSQAERLRRLLSDEQPHSTPEIQNVVYGGNHLGTARIASRVNDLRNGGLEIESYRDRENPAIWWYVLKNAPKSPPKLVPMFVEVGGVRMVRMVPESPSPSAQQGKADACERP